MKISKKAMDKVRILLTIICFLFLPFIFVFGAIVATEYVADLLGGKK